MPARPSPRFNSGDFSLHLHLYGVTILEEWRFDNLAAPYWRLYRNESRGAWVDAGAGKVPLEPGFLYLIAPDTAYSCGLDSAVRHLFVHFTIRTSFVALPRGIFRFPLSSAQRRLCEPIGRIFPDGADTSRDPANEARVMALVVDAVTGLPWDGLPPRSLDPRVERAARHLESNVGGRTPNGELARMAAMSTNAFIRLFTAETGLSPQAFGLARRMDRACILLHHTDQSIDAIAESLGFWDRNYFTKMFRKYRDTAPAAFRKRRAHGG